MINLVCLFVKTSKVKRFHFPPGARRGGHAELDWGWGCCRPTVMTRSNDCCCLMPLNALLAHAPMVLSFQQITFADYILNYNQD